MDFDTLNATVPYAQGGKQYSLTMSPYSGIFLAMPGRHWDQTIPVGGDAVVMVNDKRVGWKRHSFTHDDLFDDIEQKSRSEDPTDRDVMGMYASVVVSGKDPEDFDYVGEGTVGLTIPTFLRAVQCLAVIEHRRYARYEPKGGGRYLPLRFSYGIYHGAWTAADAKSVQRKGRPGVELLESQTGFKTGKAELLKLVEE